MTLSNDSLSVYPYGVNVTAVTVFDGTVCFKISNPQDNSWRVRLQFAGEKIMSSVYLQLPKDFKQYTDFLVLSWIITRNTDHWRELETLLQLRGYNTDTGRESQRICSLRPLTGSGFVFFCDYVASRFLELQVNTSQSGSLNNLGEYCIHLFHGLKSFNKHCLIKLIIVVVPRSAKPVILQVLCEYGLWDRRQFAVYQVELADRPNGVWD